MTSLLRIITIRTILVTLIVNEIFACTEEFDEENCAYTAECYSSISLGQNNYDVELRPVSNITTCSNIIYYEGIPMYPVHVTLTNVFVEIDDLNSYSKLITVLNLKNDLHKIPAIPEFENLALLNVSHCNLREITLTSENPLTSLITLDLSYNNITSITNVDGQFIYTNLRTLDLSHNSLQSLPDGMSIFLSKLIRFDLSHNNIQNLSHLTFMAVTQLEYLNLSNNQIIDINGSLSGLSKLTELILGNNNLISILRKDFGSLSKLEKLDLHMNSVSDVERYSFAKMTSLKYLNLSNNNLEYIEKDMFTNCSLLRNIDLSNNNLKHLENDLFRMKYLFYFNIEHNRLRGPLVQSMIEGLKFVTEIHIGHQNLTTVEDFAFKGLDTLISLFLNNNNISYLAKSCFSGLNNLKLLDLSFNKLSNLDFDKQNLQNLRFLQLRKNKITKLCDASFKNMYNLESINLSENNIVIVEAFSFANLRFLKELEISKNPLQGELIGNTFEGLSALPTLDISNTQLTIIRNSSFNGMTQLTNLNLSHSNIEEVNYNAFLETRSVEILDLSHNNLTSFFVNSTDLGNLKVLILSFNYLEIIHDKMFRGFFQINKIFLNNNRINIVEENAFNNLNKLYFIDFSFNKKIFQNIQSQRFPYLSITSLNLINYRSNNLNIAHLRVTDSDMKDVQFLKIISLNQLETLSLANNKIRNVSVMDFIDYKKLGYLDLSFNNINYIQPGSFKDNIKLYFLNISYNCLSEIEYGVFSGLIPLNIIDVSFNKIVSLHGEGYYDLQKLGKLIVDHNRITTFDPDDFSNTELDTLSIGGNPIPCKLLIALKKKMKGVWITALNEKQYGVENVNGVTCNGDKLISSTIIDNTSVDSDTVILSIRDILFNISLRKSDHSENKEQSLLIRINRNLNDIKNGIANITSQVQTLTKWFPSSNAGTSTTEGEM